MCIMYIYIELSQFRLSINSYSTCADFFRFFEPFRARLASKFAKGVQMRQFFVQKFIIVSKMLCYVEFVTTSAN
jgi:hypothetical protein